MPVRTPLLPVMRRWRNSLDGNVQCDCANGHKPLLGAAKRNLDLGPLICSRLKKRGLLPLFSLHCMLAPVCRRK